jgi:hypothetical protein
MKKPLLLFIISLLLMLVAGIAYKKYCETKPGGCKQEKFDEKDDVGPKKGIDW